MKRWLGLFALSCCGIAQAGSPVWALRGEHNTVYLAGSVHLLKAADATLPAAFDRAYAPSRVLVMEMDLGRLDPAEAAGWMLEHGMLEGGATLRETIGAERYRRVETAAARFGLPMEILATMKPWVLGMQLTELQYLQLGFDPAQGVEQQLLARAKKDGKETRGLETLSEQLGALDGLSIEDQANFLDMVVSDMNGVEGETRDILNAWRTGDTGKLATELGDEYKRFPQLYRALVTERNRHWLPQIERLLHEGQDEFVVVGALHLVGENGLLALLRRDGVRVEAVN